MQANFNMWQAGALILPSIVTLAPGLQSIMSANFNVTCALSSGNHTATTPTKRLITRYVNAIVRCQSLPSHARRASRTEGSL